MKQIFTDLKTRLQRERKAQVIAAVGLLAVLFLIFGDSGSPRRRQTAQAPSTPEFADKSEAFGDIVTRFKADLEETRRIAQQNNEQIAQMQNQLVETEDRTAEIFKKILERISETEGRVAQVGNTDSSPYEAGSQEPIPEGPGQDTSSIVPQGELKPIGFEPEVAIMPPQLPAQKSIAIISPGDTVRIRLLGGVNARTDGQPDPVIFELAGDVRGPDNSSLPLGNARLIAAASGSLTEQRSLFRLTNLSIRLPDGRRKMYSVDGWVVGEDGIRGMQGLLIDPLGKFIGAAGFAGALGGLGQGIQQRNRTLMTFGNGTQQEFVDGDVAKFAGGRALSEAADTWRDLILERVREYVPVVQVLSGREATAVFSKPVEVDDLFETLDQEDTQFAKLD